MWKVGAEGPGSFGAQTASKSAPNIAGNVGAGPLGRLEPTYLEVLGAMLLTKVPLMLRAMLGPTRLEDGGQSARKFRGPS